jgi:hypothetical protein
MAGSSFLENQLLASGEFDEKDKSVFSKGITYYKKIISIKKRNKFLLEC